VATNDVRLRNQSIDRILMNPDTIRVNQDPLGAPAELTLNQGGIQQWTRKLSNGDSAMLALNRHGNKNITATFLFSGCFSAMDIQARKDLGRRCHQISLDLPPHGTAFLRLSSHEAQTTE